MSAYSGVGCVAQHYNETIDDSNSPLEWVPNHWSQWVSIQNLGPDELLISLDGGDNYFTLADGSSFSGPVGTKQIFYKVYDGDSSEMETLIVLANN